MHAQPLQDGVLGRSDAMARDPPNEAGECGLLVPKHMLDQICASPHATSAQTSQYIPLQGLDPSLSLVPDAFNASLSTSLSTHIGCYAL